MDIGLSLPTMASGFTRSTLCDWSVGTDAGPYSSISCGERITFHNPEMMVTLGAAAALTKTVRVFANLVVAPMHPPALVAKQLATLQVLSGGRLTLGVGIGGREHDYRALDAALDHRHARLDAVVEELARLLGGGAPFDGAAPVGPPLVEVTEPPPGSAGNAGAVGASAATGRALPGIEVLAGAMGPKSLARAARWADGISGFSLTADGGEIADAVDAAERAWSDAGRNVRPRIVSGCFYVLGVDEPAQTLRGFTYDYLEIFGRSAARALSEGAPVWNEDRLRRVLDDAEAAGVDEFILVPGTVDLDCLSATTDVVTTWLSHR